MTMTNPLAYSEQITYPERVPYLAALQPEDVAPPDPRRSLDRAVQIVWRWRCRFLLVFGAVMVLGGFSLFVLPLRYTSEALVMVGSREPNPVVTDPTSRDTRERELDVDGEVQLITSQMSLRHVASELHLEQRPEFRRVLSDPGPGILVTMRNVLSGGDYPAPKLDAADLIATDLRRHLKADRLGRSALVRVAFTAGDPELAANVANAIAGSNAVDAEFRERLSVTERAGFDLLRAWVVSPASVPLVPSSPNVLIVLLGTLVAALGAAFSAVLFADYYATRMVVSADQIARRGMRALGFIPVIDRLDSGNRSAVTIVSEQPSEAFSDSIAALRASLVPLASQSASNCLVLLFASALQAEGKSTTVAALAASIASSGDRVLLIDADLRSPTLHKAFGACAAPGLSNGLDPDVGFDSLIQIDSRSGVSLLTAGSHHPRPLDVLTSARFHEAISKWRNSFDFILIDAPPVLGLADARVLVPSADYCVFVVRWGKTGWEAINHGLRLLTEAGAKIAGVAVSRINSKEFAAEGFPGAEFYSRFYREHERMGAREAWPRCDA